MPTKYRLVFTTDTGSRIYNPLTPIGGGFKALRKANTIGYCTVELPYTFGRRIFTVANPREYMLQVWRKPEGGTDTLFNTYLISKYRRQSIPTPRGKVILSGYDMNVLAYRRIVAAYAASAQARLTEEADDMMKTLFTNALSDANNPTPTAGTRAWSNLTIAEKVTKGPSLTMDFEWDKLLTFAGGGAFKKIVDASRKAGTDLFFEVQPKEVLKNSINFIFNTFTTQIGQDLTDSITLSIVNSTVTDAFVEYDYSQAVNYMYGGGKGEETDRTIVQSYNAADYRRSQWARSEGFLDDPQVDDDSLQDATDAELTANQRSIKVGGKIAQTEQLQFGRDYNFGDLVTAKIYGDQYDAMVSAVTVGMREGEDLVDVTLDYRL